MTRFLLRILAVLAISLPAVGQAASVPPLVYNGTKGQWENLPAGSYMASSALSGPYTGITGIAAITGDVTAPSGSLATTLATVNSNIGTFGSATIIPSFTVNGKGLITAVTTNSIPTATTSVLGLSKADGSTITVSGGLFSAASTTINGVTCTPGGTCSITAPATSLTPGTTTVISGTSNGLLYDNAGSLGNLATANSGVLVTSSGGAPSISTTLPNGLAMGTPASLVLTNATGLPNASVIGLGTAALENYGTSVAPNGNGQLEALLPNQTITGSSHTFVAADLQKQTRWSNSGTAMTGTLPTSGTTGVVNGALLDVANVDSTANITLSAGSGTSIAATCVTVPPGRDIAFVYDQPNTTWRGEANSCNTQSFYNTITTTSQEVDYYTFRDATSPSPLYVPTQVSINSIWNGNGPTSTADGAALTVQVNLTSSVTTMNSPGAIWGGIYDNGTGAPGPAYGLIGVANLAANNNHSDVGVYGLLRGNYGVSNEAAGEFGAEQETGSAGAGIYIYNTSSSNRFVDGILIQGAGTNGIEINPSEGDGATGVVPTNPIIVHNYAGTTLWDIDASGDTYGAGTATFGGKLTLAPPTGGAMLVLDPTQATQQALIDFYDGATGKWQLGNQSGNSFILYDVANGATPFTVTILGAVYLGEGSSQLIIPASGSATIGSAGLTTTGLLQAVQLTATGAPATVSAGQISYSGNTTASSSCGSLSGAAGCATINVAGTVRHVPYY